MGKQRKKTLQELMQERATGTGNQSAYTTEPRKIRTESVKSQVDNLYNKTTPKSFSQKVAEKYNQITNDSRKIGSNFLTSTSSNLKNSLYYIESASNKNFKSYNLLNQQLANLKEQQNQKETVSKDEIKKIQSPKEINIRNNEIYKNQGNPLLRKPTESLIQKNIGESIEKDEQKIQQNIESAQTKVGRKLAELTPSINQSLIGMGMSAINPALGMSYFQTSAGGSYTREAKAKGMNDQQAFTYGTVMGALESATESVGNKLTTKVGKAFFKDGAKEGLKAFGLDIAENFLEEAVMEPLSEYVTQLTGGQANWENIGQRMWESGINGAITSVLMGGASAGIGKAVQLVNKMQNGEQVTQKEIADTLKEINKSEEVEIEKLLFDSFKFTADDLMRNTDAQNRINQKLDTFATDISRNEFAGIKQAPTMQNEAISEQGQQTTLPKYDLPQNQFSQVFEESAKKHQIDTNNDGVRLAKNFTDKANLQLEFEKLDEKTLAVYKNGRVIVNADAIKNNPDKVLQNIVLHEAIHGKSGSKELNDVMKTVLSFAKSKGEYESARLDLDSIYAEAYKGRPDFEQLMDEEVVTNTLGEYFGTEEGLNELINYVDDRTTLQKIYDFVKDIINRVTGYKDQEQFFRRAERQLAKALQSDYVAKSGDRYFIQTVAEFNENEYNNARRILLGKTEFKALSDIINSDSNIRAGINLVETTNATYTVYFKETGEFKVLSVERDLDAGELSERNDTARGTSRYSLSSEPNIENTISTTSNDEISNINTKGTGKRSRSNTSGTENIRNEGLEESSSFNLQKNKEKQLEIIQKTNPMHDDYHTGIRSIEDIKTYQEALNDDLDGEIQDLTPDFKADELRKALETGEITVYSSYPIEQGVFVTPSKMEAGSYAGNINKVYSKKIKLSDVAWIDTLQGQYAKVEDTNVVKDNKGRTLSKEQQEYFKDSKVRDENGNLLEMYHGSPNGEFTVFRDNSYFSANEEYAKGYENTWASSSGVKKETKTPKTYKVYLNITNPFTLSNPKAKEIYLKEYIKGGNSAYYDPYTDYTEDINNLDEVDWVEGEDLIDWLKENHPEFDGILFDEGGDGGYGEAEYRWRGKSFVPFNANQIKNVDNTNPTDNPDIRYSLSQDTRKNIESKIDRYSRIVEEMQQEGRDSDEWTPYANEILRLQDQLEDSRYSYQTNGKWQEFVEKYFSREGTKTKLGDIKLPQKVVKMKDFNDLLDRAINIPQADKKALKSELKGVDLTPESLKEFEQTVNDMDKAYKELSNEILNTNQNITTRKATYNKYNKYNTEYDNSSLEKAKEVVPANKQGRRTKEQWLNVAKQIGAEIANKTNQEIEEIAYRTWQDEAPNQKSSLNRQGEKYIKFTSDEWVNTIYNTVKEQREKLSIDTNKQLPQPRKIVDEVYKEEIEEGKTRKHYQSIFESDQIGETGKEVAKELYKKDTYVPVSNLETLTDANDDIGRNGLENSYIGFSNKMNSNEKIKLKDVALGERLIQIYSENGDYEKVNNLIQDVAILGTELGQQVQALSLIKKASPEGQLQYLQKVLNRTNLKENTDIKITKDMTKTILGSKDAKQLEDNMSKVAIQIANQIPLEVSDKIRAWRYLSMLGNPKTHIKNMGANLAMNLTQGVKNKVAGGLESLVSVFNPEMERTKTLKPANKEQREFAKQDAETMEDLIDAGGKYDVKNIIQSSKRQFDNRVLNAIAEFNSNALDWEDKIFLKLAYKQAMQGYMSANNLKASDMQGEVLEKARQYASVQAQQATFHEFNAFANALNQLENKGGLVGGATSAILPFKKTPINIAKAGVEYSAIGLGKTLTYDIYQINQKTNKLKQQLKDGKITKAQYKTETSKMLTKTIDNMAKGLTGSSIALIGYFLAQKGILKAGNDDEDDEFEEKRGMQEYAVKIGDNTFTLDWVSPTAIPLFTGATIYQLATGKDDEKQSAINSALTGLSKSFEPMTEMSMLQGLTSAITSYKQGSSNMLFDLGASMITSYAGQFLPTAMGQVARTIDPYERDTSSTKKGIEGKADKFIRQSANKVPRSINVVT